MPPRDLSLIQIATTHAVYLVDALRLKTSPALDTFVTAIFRNETLTKIGLFRARPRWPCPPCFQSSYLPLISLPLPSPLRRRRSPPGFDFSEDFRHLHKLCPGLKDYEPQATGVINLSQMATDVFRFAKHAPRAKAPGGSLTRLSEDLLGTPLDKAETMSKEANSTA